MVMLMIWSMLFMVYDAGDGTSDSDGAGDRDGDVNDDAVADDVGDHVLMIGQHLMYFQGPRAAIAVQRGPCGRPQAEHAFRAGKM